MSIPPLERYNGPSDEDYQRISGSLNEGLEAKESKENKKFWAGIYISLAALIISALSLWVSILSYRSQTKQAPQIVVPQTLPETKERHSVIVPDSNKVHDSSSHKGTK